ncbi:DUF4241 domain-containing protein [Actinomadura sp. CNU-125]
MIVFPAGRGDGSYPTWIGRDPDGSVLPAVTQVADDIATTLVR